MSGLRSQGWVGEPGAAGQAPGLGMLAEAVGTLSLLERRVQN